VNDVGLMNREDWVARHVRFVRHHAMRIDHECEAIPQRAQTRYRSVLS
jgi:hypothetical protein